MVKPHCRTPLPSRATELIDSSNNVLDLYSGSARFKSRPGTPTLLSDLSRGFTQILQKCSGIVVHRLGHNHFL
jgi:hypothetical protein